MQGQGHDQNVETVEDSFGTTAPDVVARWGEELRLAGKNDKQWLHRATKVVKRYRDERIAVEKGDSKFNVLWANTETIKPALYYRDPKPMVDRRNKDRADNEQNTIAREAASVLERCLEYILDDYDFDALMTGLTEDYQLPGRAVAKVNYNPTMELQRFPAEPESYTPRDPVLDELSGELIEQAPDPVYGEGVDYDDEGPYTMEDVVTWESTDCSYVYWKDFRMGKCKTWADCPWVAFGVDMSRDDLHKRFDRVIGADAVKRIPLNKVSSEVNKDVLDDTTLELFKRARVWEIWDKDERKVHWICTDYKERPLDSGEPPLNFRHFYPCNRPLTMIENNGEHEPIPEFVMYQDQASELDTLTMRISLLVEALRVAGVYDKSNEGVKQLLSRDNENKLIPVSNWAMFSEKGGVKGAISWLPIEQIVATLSALYEAREAVKQEIYELTGIADIIRGASDPNETAAAQKIKGRFTSMRLQDKQKKVARCAKDLIRLKGEVIAENFSKETMEEMSGMEISDEAYALLQNDPMRRFAITIETDSTIQPNEREEQQSRVEFLTATSAFIKEAAAISTSIPEFTGLMGQMLMFGMRSFRVGRDLEEDMEATIEAIKQRVQQQSQQGPQPDPKAIEAQGKQQERAAVLQMKGQEHQQKMQHNQQSHQQDMVHEQQEHDQDMQHQREEDRTNGP